MKGRLLFVARLCRFRKLRYIIGLDMLKLRSAAGRVRRVHGLSSERFTYMAIYACAIATRKGMLRAATRTTSVHTAAARIAEPFPRHPLKETRPHRSLQTRFLNFLEGTAGGRLHHCRYCRIQFYDRRCWHPRTKRRSCRRDSRQPRPHRVMRARCIDRSIRARAPLRRTPTSRQAAGPDAPRTPAAIQPLADSASG